MSIVADELLACQSANMPEDDASASGGAIAPAGKVEFTDIAATDAVRVVSNGADARTITITGRLASGAIDSEALVLNGATPVAGSKLFERILKIAASAADGARTVTVTRNNGPTFTPIATLEPTITSVRRLFYNAASESGVTTRYEKIFFKNTNASLTLTAAAIQLTADPAATIRIGAAPSNDDTASVANRKTAPGSVVFVDDGVSQNIAGSALAAGSGVGVWVEMQRGANAAAVKNTFTVQLAGTTT